MKVPPLMLRRRLHYWQSHAVLREEKANTFVLIEGSAANKTKTRPQTTGVIDVPCEEEEMESALASAHDQREEELQVCRVITFKKMNLQNLA